jgi:hypothetical protein
MSDEEVLELYTGMEGAYGVLPSWEHEPIQFAHLVKMYMYRNSRNTIEESLCPESLTEERDQSPDL